MLDMTVPQRKRHGFHFEDALAARQIWPRLALVAGHAPLVDLAATMEMALLEVEGCLERSPNPL